MKNTEARFPLELIQKREKLLLGAIAEFTGAFFEVNLSRDEFITEPMRYANGQVHSILQFLNLPKDASFSNFTHKWGTCIVVDEQKDYYGHSTLKYFLDCFANGQRKVTFIHHGKDIFGVVIQITFNISLYEDSTTGDVLAFVYTQNSYELDELERRREMSERQALVDPLTGCHNRRKLESEIKTYMEKPGATGALFLIDLDDFKQVNDIMGHAYGDYLLRDMAESIRSCFGPNDIVARLGGDEFVVFMRGENSYEAVRQKAIKLHDACQKYTATADGRYLNTSISVGVVCFPEYGRTYEEVYQNADIAMYHSKKHGKNSFAFYRDVPPKQCDDLVGLHLNAEDIYTDADCRNVLDSLKQIGIYVVTERSHRLLFYNKRIREVQPNAQLGAVCSEVFHGNCENCPINILGDKPYAYTVMDTPYGRLMITVTRMLWNNRIPAIIVRTNRYTETTEDDIVRFHADK